MCNEVRKSFGINNVYQVQILHKKTEALQLGIIIQKGNKKVVRVSIQLSGKSDTESTVNSDEQTPSFQKETP